MKVFSEAVANTVKWRTFEYGISTHCNFTGRHALVEDVRQAHTTNSGSIWP